MTVSLISLLVTTTLCGSAVAAPVRYAVVIGHNLGDDAALARLRYADDDAARFYELFGPGSAQAWLLTVFDTETQGIYGPLVPLARPPTEDAVRTAFAEVADRVAADHEAGRDTEVIVYYAGHGEIAEDGQGYVHLFEGRLSRDELDDRLEAIGAATTHVVADACNAYFLVAGRGPGGKREAYSAAFASPKRPPTVGYILSTSGDQKTHEWSAWSGGIFSHQVRSGLLGAADANSDRVVDYEELAAFVALANASIPDARYRPSVYIRPPPSNLRAPILAQANLRGSARLDLGSTDEGRIEITDHRGQRYLDTHKSAGAPLGVWLMPHRSYGVRWRGAPFRLERPKGEATLAQMVPDDDEQHAARGEAHRAFQHLFEVPFGPEVVIGYRLGARSAPTTAIAAPPSSRRTWALGLLGASAAALTASAVLGGFTATTQSEAAGAPQTDRAALNDEASRYGWSTGVTFGVGLSTLATGIYLLATDPNAP